MEVGFDMIQKEELRRYSTFLYPSFGSVQVRLIPLICQQTLFDNVYSSKIAKKEDEEQFRLIEEEEKRERQRKMKKKLKHG